jgi:hypothetical protein
MNTEPLGSKPIQNAIQAGAAPQRYAWPLEGSFSERHYRVGELARIWNLGRETVRQLVKDEPGVVQIRQGRKKAHTTYSVPESVARRIHTRLSSAV